MTRERAPLERLAVMWTIRQREPERPVRVDRRDELRVPDYVEAVVAWRVWDIEDVGGRARLRSLYRAVVWPVHEPLVAECRAARLHLWWRPKHEAPETGCTCGVHAVPREHLSALANEGLWPPARFLVLGTVSLWGDVVECRDGWRASHAYPASLVVVRTGSGAGAVAAELADYGVPVHVVEAPAFSWAVREVVSRGRA